MKKTTRRLMSLVMAIAIICSMVPAAMAAGAMDNYYIIRCAMGYHTMRCSQTTSAGHIEKCVVCGTSVTVNNSSDCNCNLYGSSNPGYGDYYGHNHRYEYYSRGYHYVSCSYDPNCPYYYSSQLEIHNGSGYCTLCGYDYTGSNVQNNVVWDTPTCALYYYHTPVYQYSSSSYDCYACNRCGTLGYALKSSVGIGADSFYITGSANRIEVSGDYLLLSAVPTIAGSLVDLTQLQWFSSNSSVAKIYGSGQSAVTGSSVYVYGVSAGTATIYAQIPGTNYYATYEVAVGSATDASVMYSLTAGKSMVLDSESFENFWSEATSGYGSLDYVIFGSGSGNVGQLTYKRTGATTASSASSSPFYVNPIYNQYGIDEVTFTPAAATTSGYRTGTLTVPFTAYGSDSYYDYTNTSYSGVLYIMVTNGEVADITYKQTGSGKALVPADFVGVYKAALSSTVANPTVYIQFQNVPANGNLYYNYTAGYYSGTKLTKSNIGAMRFSSGNVATYGIDDITYVPDGGKFGDTIKYIAYSSATGGTPLYIGEIVFGAGVTPEIKYYTAINKSVDLQALDFYNIDALYNMEYFSFGTPSSGTLYKNYANGTGTAVTSGNTFKMTGEGSAAVPNINVLTYVPAANFTGVVEIPFSGSSLLGNTVSGTVKIYVAKAFSDLAGYSWASDYITRLAAEGVVNGVTATTYEPGNELKYGEALKLILEATGTSATVITDGSAHWAKNYLTKAYTKGLVTTTSIDLNSKITREQVAELAAKALGLSKASTVTGTVKPTDSTNGYVYALYNAGILNGTTVSGKNYYYGSNTINRAEIAKIICLVSDYYAANK